MSRSSERNGFTLVEAIISTILLILVIAGSYTLIARVQALIHSSRNHYVAINLSRAQLERARNFAYDQLYLLSETNIVINDSGTPYSEGYFRRTTTIQTNYQPGLTKLEVRTDIRNQKTLLFSGDFESVATLATEYLTQ